MDVVAVLGDYATICAHKEAEARWNRCEAAAALWSADHASAREAIAAVAELIEAGNRYQAALLKVSDLKEFGGPEYAYGSEWRDAEVERCTAACVFRNALARVSPP